MKILILKHTRSILSPTLCVDWFCGGAFLLKRASEMASHGSVSSFKMVKRGLSHRFLESGASNLNTKASKLQNKTTRQRKTKQRIRRRGRQGKKRIRAEAPGSHVLVVLLCSIPADVPWWAHFIWCQTVYLQNKDSILTLVTQVWIFSTWSVVDAHQTMGGLCVLDETE